MKALSKSPHTRSFLDLSDLEDPLAGYTGRRPGTMLCPPDAGESLFVLSSTRTVSMDDGVIGLGVVGCGGFGLFALQQFTQVPGVRFIGMAATHRPASLAAAARFGVENI